MERLYMIFHITEASYIKDELEVPSNHPALFTYTDAVIFIYRSCCMQGFQEIEFELVPYHHNISIRNK
jgi:hypothetical protein